MTYSKDNLRQIFQQPYNLQEWQTMLHNYFHAKDLKVDPERIEGTADDEQGYYLGAIDTTDSYRIGLFYYQIQHSNVARKRVGLRNLVKSFINPNWGEFDAALVVFDSGSVWRLSFVCDIKGENTAAKRFTYVFGESDNYYNTPVGRFDALQRNGISFENIKDAFSVERLNKDFFNGYKERYVKFLNHINDDTKENRDYVKKLLGRLVFLQFLQKKGWMGVPANNQGWTGGDKFYLNNLIESYEGNDRLLSDVLEPLFFNTLNERRDNDLADPRLGENIKIPYLNGGLFDKDDIDKKDIDFPYDYFKELMDFFAMYNFTIDENDPEDSEIGIDPEMLGHIFENLLEDNKDKGAFYTPKEIVQYMSKESVAQYLKSNTPDELHTAIDSLIKQRVVEPILQNKENARLVNKALSVVKVCDPAIGSGAFPMGVLNVLFDCRHLLYGFIGKNEDFSYAKVKRDIIQNNIYGVDIEKGAVDIARLRFWLALVVDENEPQPLPNLDYKIMCGDSLLHRFPLDAPFKDVLKDYNQKNGTHYTLDDYRQWVYDYTDISDHTQKDDFRLRIEDIKHAVKTELDKKEIGKIAKVRGTIENLKMEDLFGGKKKENEKKIKSLQKKLKSLEQQREEIESNKIYDQAFEWRFEFPALLDEDGNFTGFDIVIGNPPYNELRDLGMSVQEALKTTQYYEHAKGGRLNMFQFFYPLAIDVIKEGGIISLITQNSILAESSTFGNRKLFLDRTDILSIDSFPERDNTKTRVFESVKMSVCICTLKKKDVPNKDLVIPITVWHSKYMNDNHHIDIKKKELVDIYPDEYIFPISSNENFEILKKLIAKKEYSIVASAGEIDMTKYRTYFNLTRNGSRVLTGAQVLRYSITDTPSQGEVYYLERKYQNFSTKRANEIQNPRIVLQRITGVDSKIRIIATYSENCYLCANSTNYIVPDRNVDSLYLLGVINSKLINFFVKQTSTNTNITSKVIASFPVIISNKEVEATISRFVADILNAKQNGRETSTLEAQIDLIVYHLYGLTYDEVLIVDAGTPITQEEYNNNK